MLLGDRVAPQDITILDENHVVNYADRGLCEPMTTLPWEGKTQRLAAREGELVVVRPREVQRFLAGIANAEGRLVWPVVDGTDLVLASDAVPT